MRYAIIALAFFWMPISAHATVIHVPADQPTIQDGIDAAVNGDTVLVSQGLYVENIDFKGKNITVKSSHGAVYTTIDGGSPSNPDFASVVTFKNGEGPDAVLEGFKLTNGSGAKVAGILRKGGGIYCDHSSPTIRDNIISWNTLGLTGYGGGICSIGSSSMIKGNLFQGNEAGMEGGGLWCKSGTITNNYFLQNISAKGGAIFCMNSESSPAINNNTFQLNETYSNPDMGGGGLYVAVGPDHSDPLVIVTNEFLMNTAENGGGLMVKGNEYNPYWPDVVVIENNLFESNEASARGGGLYCWSHASPVVRENTFMENNAETDGGGMGCRLECNPMVTDNSVRMNTAGHDGGGMCFGLSSPFYITNNIISNNTAEYEGGGVRLYSCDEPVLVNNIISKNQAYSGGGVHCSGTSTTMVTNNTITANIAENRGGGLVSDQYNDIIITNTLLWNNVAQTGEGNEICCIANKEDTYITISFSDLKGGKSSVYLGGFNSYLIWGPGMIDADPLFVDAGDEDCHLRYFSPCKDTGDPFAPYKPSHDFEGDPRGSKIDPDMGADEFYRHLYVTGDKTPGGSIKGKLIGVPGTSPTGLFFGSGILKSPIPTAWGYFYLQAPWLLIPLVPIAGGGVLVLPATIPATYPAPYDLPMQALIGLDPGSLTNLEVLEVR